MPHRAGSPVPESLVDMKRLEMYYLLCPKVIINVLAITTLQTIHAHTREKELYTLQPSKFVAGCPCAREFCKLRREDR